MTDGHDQFLQHEPYLELCAGYALDALQPHEVNAFEAHLPTCPICQEALDSFTGVAPALAFGVVAPVPPPPAVRARLLDAIGGGDAGAGGPSDRGGGGGDPPCLVAKALAVIALGVAGVFATMWWQARGQQRATADRVETLSRERDVERDRAEAATRRLDEIEALLQARDRERDVVQRREEVLRAPGAVIASFAPTADAAAAAATDVAGRVIYDASTRRAVVVLTGLQAPDASDFELWSIGAAGPRSLGVVRVDADGRALLLVDVDASEAPAAFAISLEASGGSSDARAPQGPVGLVAALGG
jgi:hypothetical protein